MHVIIPFGFIIILVILAFAAASVVVGAIAVVIAWLALIIALLGAPLLAGLGLYRMIRTIWLRRYRRPYAITGYTIWIGLGTLVFSAVLSEVYNVQFTSVVGKVSKEPLLFFWTREVKTYESFTNFWGYLYEFGKWCFLCGCAGLIVEFIIRQRQVICDVSIAAARQAKRKLDGSS